jgi:asparaginyl-tRNA synthetase
MIEPEVAFAGLDDLVGLAEGLVCRLVEAALGAHGDDLRTMGRDVAALGRLRRPFPRITYSEAVELLRSPRVRARLEEQLRADRAALAGKTREITDLEERLRQPHKRWQREKLENQLRELQEEARELDHELANRPGHIEAAQAFEWGRDLGGDEETIISQQFEQPVFVTEYPRQAKAFYMKPRLDRPEVVMNLDLLAPEGYGEILGGSVREERADALLGRMEEEGMDPGPYEWYLDLRRYGTVPHGGFGLGIERTMAWICGLPHVREAIPFPRLLGRMYP